MQASCLDVNYTFSSYKGIISLHKIPMDSYYDTFIFEFEVLVTWTFSETIQFSLKTY